MNEKIKLTEILRGKRTYICAAAIIVLGVLEGLGIFKVPEVIWIMLGAGGLAGLRAGVKTLAKVIDDLEERNKK